MKPVVGTVKHDPDNGIYGNCQQLCVAAILELPLSEVPHFLADGDAGDEWRIKQDNWFRSRGEAYIVISFAEDPRPFMALNNPNIYYILGIKSPIADHSVVALNDKIVYDPNGYYQEEIEPCSDGYFWVEIIGTPKTIAKEQNGNKDKT